MSRPRADRQGAVRFVARLAVDHGVADRAEQRLAVGEPAALLGQIAAEEAADLIVLRVTRAGGWAAVLKQTRPPARDHDAVPVLIAPRRTPHAGKLAS